MSEIPNINKIKKTVVDYNKIREYLIDERIDANLIKYKLIEDKQYTEGERLSFIFYQPLKAFVKGEGNWTIHDPLDLLSNINENILNKTTEIYLSKSKEFEWYILAKLSDSQSQNQTNFCNLTNEACCNYFYLDAKTCWSGFECSGEGTIALTNNWDDMWNLYMDNDKRDILLRENNLDAFKIEKVKKINKKNY